MEFLECPNGSFMMRLWTAGPWRHFQESEWRTVFVGKTRTAPQNATCHGHNILCQDLSQSQVAPKVHEVPETSETEEGEGFAEIHAHPSVKEGAKAEEKKHLEVNKCTVFCMFSTPLTTSWLCQVWSSSGLFSTK